MRMREASLVVIANPRAGDRLPVLLRRISLRLALLDEIARCYSSAQLGHQHGNCRSASAGVLPGSKPRRSRSYRGAALDDVQHLSRACVLRQRVKVRRMGQRFLEQSVELAAVDLDGAELLQMLGDELRIEQREAAPRQA